MTFPQRINGINGINGIKGIKEIKAKKPGINGIRINAQISEFTFLILFAISIAGGALKKPYQPLVEVDVKLMSS